MFSLHAEARHGRVGKAGTVRELFHTADVTHGLLPLPQSRGWDLHLVLLIWEGGARVRGKPGRRLVGFGRPGVKAIRNMS